MIKEFEKRHLKANVPELKPGMIVRVQQKIREGDKERLQSFEGIIIQKSPGSGTNKTFTIRKVVDGVGVEKILPLHSPTVAKIDVIREMGVRRSKLYYLRDIKRTKHLYEVTAKRAALKKSK